MVMVMIMIVMIMVAVIFPPESESVENHANEGEEVDGQGGRLVPVCSAQSRGQRKSAF